MEEVKRNVLRNINSSQEEVSLAKHLLLVSPEERPLGSNASAQHRLVERFQRKVTSVGKSAGAKLSFLHVSSQRAREKQQRLRTFAAAAAHTPEERKINSASLE